MKMYMSHFEDNSEVSAPGKTTNHIAYAHYSNCSRLKLKQGTRWMHRIWIIFVTFTILTFYFQVSFV